MSAKLRPRSFRPGLALLALLALGGELQALPFFARSQGMSCLDCHAAPPKLNARGEAFLARGYRAPPKLNLSREAFFERGGRPATPGVTASAGEIPLSVWITGRREERSSGGADRSFLPKVELISGGPVADLPLSYFVEWRVVSLDLRGNGTLRDRGGRFEDVVLNWEIGSGHALRVGQFRALNQYDVSLRLSVSEPTVFSTALPGERSPDARITGLRAFSPSGRSPGLAYSFQSIQGQTASDGLFHIVTLPFVGELSLPLGDEARREASFELEGPAKGLFLETFYRRKLNSLGAHAFIDDKRRLLTGVGRLQHGDFHATAALGLDDAAGRDARTRYSLEVEYLPSRLGRIVPGVGFRLEQITRAGRDPAYVPYFVFTGPNTQQTLLLQIEARFQGASRTVFVDLSTIF